jgi:hypothetical protein
VIVFSHHDPQELSKSVWAIVRAFGDEGWELVTTAAPGAWSNSSAQRRANRPAGESPARANRQRSPEANSPASDESLASKRGGA